MTIYREEIDLENMVSIFLTKLHNNDISDVRKDIDYNYAPFYLHIDQLQIVRVMHTIAYIG